ncbi:hypothetical protein Agub_g6530, partial [Astrephomene gubernaculifera]
RVRTQAISYATDNRPKLCTATTVQRIADVSVALPCALSAASATQEARCLPTACVHIWPISNTSKSLCIFCHILKPKPFSRNNFHQHCFTHRHISPSGLSSHTLQLTVSLPNTFILPFIMRFLIDWFYSVLSFLGLRNKSAKILFLGLENAGKTTLMHMLRDDRVSQHPPTQHPTSEEVQLGGITFKVFDLGGHKIARRIWKDYFAQVDAVVFLVDSSDRTGNRLSVAKDELQGLLGDPSLAGVPFLVLGNKIDLPNAVSEDELRTWLGLSYLTTGKGGKAKGSYVGSASSRGSNDKDESAGGSRPCEVFMCSVVRRMGYGEGFRWLSQYIE